MMRLSRVRSQGQGGLINFVPAQIDCRTTLKPRGTSSAPTARPISLPLRAIEQEKVQQTSDLKDATARSVKAETSGRQVQSEPSKTLVMPYKLIAGLAATGAAITGYLTVERLSGGSVVCPASGSCETILSSEYASIFGIPLSLLGLLAYSSVAGVAVWQVLKKQQDQKEAARLAMLGGGTALAATSSSLLYLLATQFPGQSCTWCLASAFLSFSIFATACSGFKPRELAELAAPGGLTAASVVLFLSLAWSGVEAPQALANINIPYQATVVESASSPRALAVVKRLKEAGAKFYGAFWCSHCQDQKVAFGKEAQMDLPYIECYPEGYKSGMQMTAECQAANLTGFPMWVINGQRYEGEQSVADLEYALRKSSPDSAFE